MELAGFEACTGVCVDASSQAPASAQLLWQGVCLRYHTNVGVSSAHITQLLVTCSLATLSGYGALLKTTRNHAHAH